ncbi:MAG: DUF429 domain-containing protein [Polyangiales bacterium]
MKVFSGFDSAWGGRQCGAACHLLMERDGALRLDLETWRADVTWRNAFERLRAPAESSLHVIAIDQPLVVPNVTGSRPVDVGLARALMRNYAVGAHSANTTNPCFAPAAGIWKMLSKLNEDGYQQDPLAVARRDDGKFYFECYPNAALVGWLDFLPRYKFRHRNADAWTQVVDLLRGLATSDSLPVENIMGALPTDFSHSKKNEDMVDAIIAAYTAAFLWRHGLTESQVIGDFATGYMVTPVNLAMRPLLAGALVGSLSERDALNAPARIDLDTIASPALEARSEGAAETRLVCTDTTNLWGNRNGWMYRFADCVLCIRFVAEDGAPVVRFVPFTAHGAKQRGLKADPSDENRARWRELTEGASSSAPFEFDVEYWYE